MNLDKCVLRIKVLRLFMILGAFSSVAVFLIYSLPNGEKESLATNFNQGLFSAWSKSANHQTRSNQKASINQPLKGHGKSHQARGNREDVLRNKIKRLTSNHMQNDDSMILANATKKLPKLSLPNVHIFYSLPVEWSHMTTSFWPQLGTYSPDNRTLRHQFENIQLIGANVLIVTWSPFSQEQLLWHLFDEAHNFGIKITIEIDNYPNRTASTIFNDIQYFYKEFWDHQSLYRVFVTSKNTHLPMIYIRNVDCLPPNDWKSLISPSGEYSVRSALRDAVFIGHISTRKDVSVIKVAQFNGFYSRTVSNGATYASTWKYWSELKKSADKFKLLFIPAVGPGYDEYSKQPKIASTRRHRTNGQYYGVAWRAAISIGAEFINIHSYNDWLSGTQIEEAIPRNGFKDYSPGAPTKYLDLTRYWINEYIKSWPTDAVKRLVDVKLCSSYFNNTVC